jgi:hypothetical protein
MRNVLLAVLFCLTLFAGIACEREGPAERAGERVDETVESVGEKAEEATEK